MLMEIRREGRKQKNWVSAGDSVRAGNDDVHHSLMIDHDPKVVFNHIPRVFLLPTFDQCWENYIGVHFMELERRQHERWDVDCSAANKNIQVSGRSWHSDETSVKQLTDD